MLHKLLVIDDEDDIREVASLSLELTEGWTVRTANGGSEGTALALSMEPDAILLDWNMPNMSGIEFLRVLRREPSGGKPIVVFCTTENDIAHITEAIGAGANDYIMKPFDKDIVEAKFAEAGLM